MANTHFRPLARILLQQVARPVFHRSAFLSSRSFSHSVCLRSNVTHLNNILEGGPAPPVSVKTVTPAGVQLDDGLLLPAACIFLEGKVFLWDVPQQFWEGWGKEHFEIFEATVPKPELLLLGTGKKVKMIPPALRLYLSRNGINVEVMDTWNACSTYNLLLEEGRRVAAALLPLEPRSWPREQALQL
ncbi:hypothetical protein CERSUDRAFT_111176 [Gelatoporia subvermispora B]|uniref:NADH dehydrogenase [ubiquinone] 1 alpha subcomplex assembly factor 3 n=1 Tax=Ceriporiopsis subvermispora (strain B) TaxID=914234 RepID=M2R821_CERS8|nr:hypothetical protein CERSUDRAFT_111176 [Gelatoporia subvermispora B]